MRKKILTALMLSLTIFTCSACAQTKATSTNNSNPQQLQILKSDLKLTQEQVMSQIKAEHLIENNGYLDNDEVVTIITLNTPSLIDNYLDFGYLTYKSISEYALSNQGKIDVKKIDAEQNQIINELKQDKLIDSVEYQYSTILNGIAVKTTYKNFQKLSSNNKIKSTILSDTYNLPQASTTDSGSTYSAVENIVEVYETGIYKSDVVWDQGITGKGTVVAVLDSGFDCSHSVFAKNPAEPKLNDTLISNFINTTDETKKLNAVKFTPNLKTTDVYYSSKIPFAYDYADKDTDVYPYDSEHGTHVAGIIGGYDDVITGIAIDTQLVLMKVFPDLDSGGKTEDIMAALEDAVILGVDAINMSLGSSCGFAREADNDALNELYDNIEKSGISLITAASNSYSSGYGGEQGNTNFVTNPDSGTVGSPSTYDAALSVASISGVKSSYLVANDSQIIFFKESNSISGKENNFFDDLFKNLGKSNETQVTLEYVTVPGVGSKSSYNNIDVRGKIALVKRGDNTFEEKTLYAKRAGAVACIIYNNVDGDILMSMGKQNDYIPTISISKDDGTILASKASGTIVISYENQAGPFMSDFSSWGPTPSLGLKPEITAHGGKIKSAIPGGGYDELSGTSMATPNLCGIVVLIRQYLKGKYPDKTDYEIAVLTNQLLMSTASIVLNEEGNPYSPRKQGAGLASIRSVVNTNGYITVDGSDRTKLELKDDPNRTGVYEMEFNVVNLSETDMLSYDLSVIGMTETVSSSDDKHVAEKATILDGSMKVELLSEGTLNDKTIILNPGQTVKVKVTYTLSSADKKMINEKFPYGMYVEGFVKLKSNDEGVDLNIPFLGFYGDWSEAPMFDKTYYEVEKEAHDASIDDEDKLKADYYVTTPYGSYMYNYLIPLGTYLYDIDESQYDAIPASTDHIALSNILGTIDGIAAVYAGLLRNAKTMTFTITDKITGEVIKEYVDYNANKAYSMGSSPYPYFEYLKWHSSELGLINNRQYEFKMSGLLDYENNGAETNVRNTFSFDFYLDDEAPIIKDVQYEKKYDKTLKKDRYYITMTVYDNQYVQSISPLIFTSSSTYSLLTENPIPVYSEKGKDTVVKFEITDYLENIYDDSIITSALAFSIDDYALNSNIYLCQLPGTKGEFKFTKDGTMDGIDLIVLSMYEDEIIDITKYLATSDETVDDNKDYLNHLVWSSSNELVAEVKEGQVKCLKAGRATITVAEAYEGNQAILIINVKERPNSEFEQSKNNVADIENAKLKNLRFSYFDTKFAYSRAAQTSTIGSTGDRTFIDSLSSLSFYPGEQIKLYYDVNPWYVESKYDFEFTSTDPSVATVDENGVVTGLKEGTTIITLTTKDSKIQATITIEIKSPFVIDSRTLIAYKGIGDENGVVEIPDDEGILYIGAYAFCLYETDRYIEVDEDDYDKNKIPASNPEIKKVIIPEGVEEIQKYAFYNCGKLEEVIIPSTTKIIREYAFCRDVKLEKINLETITVIGREAFGECKKLNNIDLPKIYAIGVKAFNGCESLTKVDLTTLRNTGRETFKNCTSLEEVILSEHTKLSEGMFYNSGLVNIDIYETGIIPASCFETCEKLVTVTIHNDIVEIGERAFSSCSKLTNVTFNSVVEQLGELAFYNDESLVRIKLPNNAVTIGKNCFYKCEKLEEIEFDENTIWENIDNSMFLKTNLTKFVIHENNKNYKEETGLLLNQDGTIILLALTTYFNETLDVENNKYVINEKYQEIASGAFAGINFSVVEIENKAMVIGAYAFAHNDTLTKVILPNNSQIKVLDYAFYCNSKLKEVENLDKVISIGEFAFAKSGLVEITIGDDVNCETGAFTEALLEKVTFGSNVTLDFGVFQNCKSLKEVIMPTSGVVNIGTACFANDIQLANIDLSKAGKELGQEAFFNCTKLKVANLENVEIIGKYAFADCAALASVQMPKVVEIQEGAFTQYSSSGSAPTFSKIVLPQTLKYINAGAFAACTGLTEIEIPEGVKVISNSAFKNCINMYEVILPSSVNKIEELAFYGCEKLQAINLTNVEIVDNYAFYGCTSLESIDTNYVCSKCNSTITSSKYLNIECPNCKDGKEEYKVNPVALQINIKKVGDGAFSYCSSITSFGEMPYLEEIGLCGFQYTSFEEFNAPNLKVIGDYAFQMNESLKEFTFSKSLEKMGIGSLGGCSSLAKYYYLDNNENKEEGTINDYAKLIGGALYVVLPSGHLELNSIPAALDVVDFEVAEDTYRIEVYAGNANKNIKVLRLPDSLKTIGNYAFYECDNLMAVEFRSFTAPILEDEYNETSSLLESDPGYNQLHAYIDLFGYELYYYNFIDLVGKKNPIGLIIPDSPDIEGYDSLVYQVYFGLLEDAEISDYEPMHKNMITFVNNALKIEQIKHVALTDEELINEALTAYNAITQDPSKYGYNEDEWKHLYEVVRKAKNELSTLQFENASNAVKNLQAEINELPETFDISLLSTLKDITTRYGNLTTNERSLLDMTNYNKLVESYKAYVNTITEELGTTTSSSITTSSLNLMVVIAICAALIIRKRMFK